MHWKILTKKYRFYINFTFYIISIFSKDITFETNYTVDLPKTANGPLRDLKRD